MKDIKKIEKLLQKLREVTFNNTKTKDEIVPDEDNLAKSLLDDIFDIDIFYSRKPGMRRSVQLIKSDLADEECVKYSCLTAISSLCDTMIANKELNVNERDILTTLLIWLENHNIGIDEIEKNL